MEKRRVCTCGAGPAHIYTLGICEPLKGNAHDPVNSPSHYADQAIETIDYLESCLTLAEFIGFCKGNAIKYSSRAGKKEGALAGVDMDKARWYSERARNRLAKEHEANEKK